jgi:uncharacterized protein YaiL (DUF2058 family)
MPTSPATFPTAARSKRVYVTAEQLKALNAGELGVLQLDGRYLLVSSRAHGAGSGDLSRGQCTQGRPNAPVEDDPYADPQFQVPDDLVW